MLRLLSHSSDPRFSFEAQMPGREHVDHLWVAAKQLSGVAKRQVQYETMFD